MRLRSWGSDVCSSVLFPEQVRHCRVSRTAQRYGIKACRHQGGNRAAALQRQHQSQGAGPEMPCKPLRQLGEAGDGLCHIQVRHMDDQRIETRPSLRSEEHTSELQSLMRSSYAVFCLKKKN